MTEPASQHDEVLVGEMLGVTKQLRDIHAELATAHSARDELSEAHFDPVLEPQIGAEEDSFAGSGKPLTPENFRDFQSRRSHARWRHRGRIHVGDHDYQGLIDELYDARAKVAALETARESYATALLGMFEAWRAHHLWEGMTHPVLKHVDADERSAWERVDQLGWKERGALRAHLAELMEHAQPPLQLPQFDPALARQVHGAIHGIGEEAVRSLVALLRHDDTAALTAFPLWGEDAVADCIEAILEAASTQHDADKDDS